MVPYNNDRRPSLPWNQLNSMQASIVLDQPGNVSFTNLDQISGKVVLRCGKSINIDQILVKLEGESRTRLLSPSGPNGEKPKPQLEYHKVSLALIREIDPTIKLTDDSCRYCIGYSLRIHALRYERVEVGLSRKMPTHSGLATMSFLSNSRYVVQLHPVKLKLISDRFLSTTHATQRRTRCPRCQ